MSEIKVNKISPKQTCTQVTLGDSGDTFTIPAGVTLTNNGTATGFGPTGAVSWDTTPKTTTVTAASGVGYFVDTTLGAITVNLPAGSAGDIVAISDYANTAATNNITIARNGTDKINGVGGNFEISTNGVAVTLVYVDSTIGWKDVNDATLDVTGIPPFIAATGGTVTCCGDYKIHTFTGPGTFTVTNAGNPSGSDTVDYLVVAGGGGGGGDANTTGSGGGGAGGYRESSGAASGCYSVSPLGSGVSALPVSVQGYPITVGSGGGGGGGGSATPGSGGNNSVFSTITSTGGGGGSGTNGGSGNSGGSGGGGKQGGGSGSGNTPPTSPPQGNNGGTGDGGAPAAGGGGGGGAVAVGVNGTGPAGGNGGAGTTSCINATPTTRAGGGGGGVSAGGTIGTGGVGGGGNGSNSIPVSGGNGTVNTGGGAGGGGGGAYGLTNGGPGGSGGSGIVIIRYKFQ